MFTKKIRTYAPCAAALMMGVASQGVFAHAGFKDQITEGSVNTWNAVTITHGCNSNVGGEGSTEPHKDVIAFSAVFPNSPSFSDVIFRKSNGTVPAQTGAAIGHTTEGGDGTVGNETVIQDLSLDIVGATASNAGTPKTIPMSISTVGVGNIFANAIPIADASANVRGWQSWAGNGPKLTESQRKADGSGDISMTGLAPFRINKFEFVPASCVKKLVIRAAVANWCGKGNSKPDSVVDVWIGELTSKFNNLATMPNAVPAADNDPNTPDPDAGAIFWPSLTINRDLGKNPLPGTTGFNAVTGTVINGVTTRFADCTDPNAYDTVYIEPTKADIDTYLPLKKAKYPKGVGAKYWPTN